MFLTAPKSVFQWKASPTSRTSLLSSFSPSLTARRSDLPPSVLQHSDSCLLCFVKGRSSGWWWRFIRPFEALHRRSRKIRIPITAKVATADVGNKTRVKSSTTRKFDSLETLFHWENVFGCGQEHVLKIVYLLAKVGWKKILLTHRRFTHLILSHHSHIMDSWSDRVKNSLSLQPIQSETMSIKTFGSSDDNKQSCDVVNLGFQLKDGDYLELPLFSVTFICVPLSSQVIDLLIPLHKHLADLDFADCPYVKGWVEIDILIDCDHYWKFARAHKGEDPPTMGFFTRRNLARVLYLEHTGRMRGGKRK